MKCAHTCKAENKPHTCSTSNTCNKSFYKALRHPVAAFHCRPLKNQHRQNAGRPSLVPQKFSSNPGQNSTKKPPIPLFFFLVFLRKIVGRLPDYSKTNIL